MNRMLVYWAPGVGMVQQLAQHDWCALTIAFPQRDPQKGEDQVSDLGRGDVPAHDPLGEDEGDEDESRPVLR